VNSNGDDHPIQISTIGGINQLPMDKKRAIYCRVIPKKLLEIYDISPTLIDPQGNDLLELNCPASGSLVDLSFYHRHGAQDPVMYGEITDTLNGQIHILFYTIRDPDGPRFDVDKMPDGTSTKMGTLCRNLEAEKAAMEAGLAPAQIRPGLRLLAEGIEAFEDFVLILGQTIFFSEPLHYHNAVILERHGFAYQQGRRLMEHIQAGFAAGGYLLPKLDNSTPFRQLEAAHSLRLRSWAIHDGILGEPYTNVTMYKVIGKDAGVYTCGEIPW
jgi:hypothetical protein